MKTPPDATPTRRNAPLARDSDGNPFELPDGAAYWRVRRQTGGRPRKVLGVDRQPLRVPLEMTAEELEDVLGPSSYLLDLHDQAHNALNVTVPVTVGAGAGADETASEPREAAEGTAAVVALPATSSEVRLVLEANIRAMSASFQHNERQLVASQRMAETLRDGVRVLADAQADWIKSLTNAKGYLRNAGANGGAAPPRRNAADPASDDDGDYGNEVDDDDEVEDDYEVEDEVENEAEPKDWVDRIGEQLVPHMPMIMAFLSSKLMPASGPAAPTTSASPPPSEGWKDKLRNIFDWRRAAEIGAARRAGNAAAAAPAPAAPTATLMEALATAPPDVVAKLMALRQQLSPAEQEQLMHMFAMVTPAEVPDVIAQVQRTPADQLAATMRELLAAPPVAPAVAPPAQP